MSRSVYGIDFGTSNIKIYNGMTKTTLNEKNIIAIKNKNELKRRIDLFLHDFTHEEYRINEEYCKETMRIMVDFIGHVDNRLDAADKRLKKAKAGEKALAEYIISNAHSCPIPVEMVCKPGFQQIGCVQCLIKHLDVLNKPRED